MAKYSPVRGVTLYGSVVVIRRSGEDGSVFPMMTQSCVLGRYDLQSFFGFLSSP